MSKAPRVSQLLELAIGCALFALGCANSKTWQDHVYGIKGDDASMPMTDDASMPTDAAASVPGKKKSSTPAKAPACVAAVSSDHLPPRSTVMVRAGQQTMMSADMVFTRDLFNLFRSNCGGCHVDQMEGGLHVSLDDFPMKITMEAVNRISSDDPSYFMPPPAGGGKPFSTRSKDDPIVELVSLLEAWLAAGSPADAFTPKATADNSDSTVSYQLTPGLGMAMTNLANCVPEKAMVGMDQQKNGDALDTMFANATDLPDRLEQTDMISLDAEALARSGVVAFAPAYTLWADNAKKIRMVRVPRGTSIAFDKDKQSFTIPPNTRFYKTFFKHVIDLDGNDSYRKMETRLIVSRPDTVNADGSRTPNALFGTYAWNEQETEAVLVRDPYRDGKPFRDRLTTFVTDEQKADVVISSGPDNLQQALEDAGLTRTYAIPGSDRCVQCHMGSPNASFVLGFQPLQINRRPMGQGGVIEPADRDELNQLQRLIDYGIVTGMSSPDDVTLLEDSQGERKPRNQHELDAQGYMLGNCSHCHNPYGFPSVTAPELRDVLSFLPTPGPLGGIFQFPLEKFSPRVFRGDRQDIQVPYITPYLYDLNDVVRPNDASASNVARKVYAAGGTANLILAPWRSLIYRNVETPFTYTEDSAIFPHMPRNTPGYDCRVRQLLGQWMVSIPARFKKSLTMGDGDDVALGQTEQLAGGPSVVRFSAEPQPYEEITPDDPEYASAQAAVSQRLAAFRQSPRFTDCPDPKLDVVDPAVRDHPEDTPAPPPISIDTPDISYDLPVPAREHWFVTDLTDAPGDWGPRRADWQSIIHDHDTDLYRVGEAETVDLLSQLHVTGNDELRNYALTDIPFALWQEKPQCTWKGVSQVKDLASDSRPSWVAVANNGQAAPESAHVYSISPGAQTFTSICRNCHGPQADAKSRLADTIADLTGGATRVANLHDGIFGPSSSPGANRMRVFGSVADSDTTADDWASRYVAWMTLGGTQRLIPPVILATISNIRVFGQQRADVAQGTATANMLSLGRTICNWLLPAPNQATGTFQPRHFDVIDGQLVSPTNHTDDTDSTEPEASPTTFGSAVFYTNGDADMWTRLCTLQNPLPVRRIIAKAPQGTSPWGVTFAASATGSPYASGLYRRDAYGNAPVGDQSGAIHDGIDDANLAPWCIEKPAGPMLDSVESFWAAKHSDGSHPPYCPDALLVDANQLSQDDTHRWATRGAMNAALSVFMYLDALAKGDKQPAIEYTACDSLPNN